MGGKKDKDLNITGINVQDFSLYIFEEIQECEPTLESIEINIISKLKRNYIIGEKLDISGLVVIGSYSDGGQEVLKIDESNIIDLIISREGQHYKIINKQSSKVLTMSGSIDGAPIILMDYIGEDTQLWTLDILENISG